MTLGQASSNFFLKVGPTAHRYLRCSHAHIWYIFGPIMQNHCYMPKTKILGALLVAIGLQNSYMNFHPDCTKFGRLLSKEPYAHIWAYAPNLIDFGP